MPKVNFVLNYDVPPSLTSYICRLGLCQHALTQVQVSRGYAQGLSLFYAQKLQNDVDDVAVVGQPGGNERIAATK